MMVALLTKTPCARTVVPPFSGQLSVRVGRRAIHRRHPAGVPMQGERGSTTVAATAAAAAATIADPHA
jgi:hypothetical protein